MNSTNFTLSPPFHSVNSVNIDDFDVYSQTTFRELIQEQESKELPYFLALTKTNQGKVEISDGTAFVRNYYWQGRKISPITRGPINEAYIYQIDRLKDETFKYLGDLSTLRKNKDHLLKFINACDPNLEKSKRGMERFYMGYSSENGIKASLNSWLVEPDLKKAFFWYNKSKEDQYFGGPIALVSWYETGNQLVEKSEALIFQNLKLAADWVPENSPHAADIYQDVCVCYEKTGKKLCNEDEFKKYNLLLEKIKKIDSKELKKNQ